LKAEREEDVTDALTIFGLDKFSDSNWLPYGGIENNYGIIGAQQADAIGALVEKVVNSIDAVLMRECFAINLDPRSNIVRRSMSEAAEQFLNVPDGNLAKWSAAQRTELAERNISIIVTGQKPSEGNPCVIVVDTGEGQNPEDFKDTLVSLLRSNKTSVPFVQGKIQYGEHRQLDLLQPQQELSVDCIETQRCHSRRKDSEMGVHSRQKTAPPEERKERAIRIPRTEGKGLRTRS